MFGDIKTEMPTDLVTTGDEKTMKPTLKVWAGDDGVNATSPHVAIDLGCILNYPVITYRLRKL